MNPVFCNGLGQCVYCFLQWVLILLVDEFATKIGFRNAENTATYSGCNWCVVWVENNTIPLALQNSTTAIQLTIHRAFLSSDGLTCL